MAKQRRFDGEESGEEAARAGRARSVEVKTLEAVVEGDLSLPAGARGLVMFAHGSGSIRTSPRNRFVAGVLRRAGLGTLLFDLLTSAEEEADAVTMDFRFDIALLARRLIGATDWLTAQRESRGIPIGYFGASTGAAAALIAATERAEVVGAIVSRGGRPDLAGPSLARVHAPTLLIVGGRDRDVLRLNREAMERLTCAKALAIVPGATHLFGEPGALEQVASTAASWFVRHLARSRANAIA
jgi:dienelactone hydrolase